MRYVAVTSGKGGTGKTAISINFGICLAQKGKRVLLFDGDLGLANLDIQLGLQAQFNLSHVVSGEKRLNEVIVDAPGGLKILPGASGVIEMESLSPEMHARLLRDVRTLDQQFDIVLIDTGAGISNSVQLLNSAADEVIIVMTPDPSALMDAYAMIKLLAMRCGKPTVRIIVNQTRTLDEATDVIDRLRRVAAKFLPSKLELLGAIGYDRQMQEAVRKGKPAALLSPDAASVNDIRSATNRWMTMPPVAVAPGGTRFWDRVLELAR